KDQYGSVLKKYETESDRIGLKVYEYDLKGSLVSETDRNGVKTPYSYTRDSIDGHVVSVETTSSIYSGYLTTTLMDEVGNVTSVVDTNGITKTYTYEKDTGGILTGKTEHVSKIENTVMVLDYTDHYSYTIDEEISSFTDKNNVIRTNEYKCDGYGNIEYVTVTASWNAGTKSKITRKEYNLDGTESSVTYINNPADSGDDVIKTFSYTYDSINGTLIQMVETDSRFSAGTTYEYNFLGDIASVTSPNGIITIYTYERDIKGNLIKRYEENSLYADSVEMSGFDIYNNKVSFTNSNGYIFDYENTYDLSGNLIQVIETHDRYGANDVLLWSSTETKIYNILGRITSITDKNGITLTYTYDTNGQGEVTASYETDGRYTGQVIRNFNSLTSDISSITNRMGHITDFTYEYSSVHGGITGKTETVFLGGTTAYNFDGYGRINSITDKFGKVVSITPDFDTYGNMYKRTLTWTEDLNNVTPDFEEQEFYSVDGDLVRRIDYTGKEFRYQYEKDSVGSLKYMTSIESSREKYTLLDTNPVVSITSNGSGSYLPLLCDDKIAYHSTVSWADANDPASFVIDLGDNAFEYNAMKLYLYQGEGRAYKYKIFTASDLNSAWTMVDNKTDVFYSDIQESEFDTTNNRYVMIQGSDASPVGTLRLEIQEVEFYKKEQVETLNLVTSEYDTNGRVVSKTGTTGETVYYSYEIGDKGEVVKVYERLTPETTVGVLLGVPIKSENVSLMGAYPSQDPNEPLLHIYDDHLGTRGGFNWYGESTPGSLILDLTDDNSNIDDLSAFGIQVRTSEDDIWFGYKVYYATAENPNTWIELLDRSNHKIGMQDRWFVEKFDAPVSGKYIRLQGGPSWQTGNFQIEEIEVYREEQRTNALKVKELDEYGKTITEKNALMLAWEENESLQQIFPNAGKKSVVAGYWNDKSITEWARMVGAWEDPRIKAYLSDFDNKTYPAIESAFERGDVNDKLLNVSYVNNSEQLGSPLNIIDGIFTTRDYIKWTDDNNPGYYLIEFSEDTQIDKIRLKLYDDNHRKTFKYRIYTSLDGQTWSDAIILNDTDFVTYWQEHRFENVTTRYLKIEGAGCRLTYDPVYAPQNYVDIKQLYLEDIMIFDTSLSSSSPREYAENALKDWAKKLGFRTDAELIKFAKTDLVTDEPELKTYTYMLDDNGTVRRMSEASLFTGASLKFFDAKGRLIEEVESKITETIVTPITEWQGESFCEYDTYGNLISKKDILAVIWEENADMRKSFVTPDALATDPYEGYYTLKDWAYNIGRFEDSRLADFDNHDPYLVYYSYDRDENGTLRNMAKTVNMKQQTLTWYDAIGQFIGEETNSLNVTRNIHTYAYHMNGNLSKTTTVKSGYENRNCESFYNSVGDMVLYQDDRAENFFYRYTYTSDRWNNAVKVYVKPAHPDYGNPWETMFLTSEETLVQEEAEERIIEYFRAMVYREPTADELALHLADWEKTGFTNLARELIRQSDEYKNGDFITFAQQAENLRNSRIAGLQSAFTIAASNKQTLLDGLNNIVTQISANYQALQTVYQSKKDDNDKKYIKEIYRNILGREGTEDEINTELIYMRANNKTLEDMRARVQAYSEYTDRKAAIQNIINALYDSSTDTGLLKDYLNSEDKYDYITNTLGYVVNREFLHNITSDQIQAIISWLATQDNHFGRSAVQALYKQLDSAGIQNIPDTDSLLKELIFLDIVTGVITEDTQGLLLISMHAIKKAAKAYGLDLYGTAYDADEFLSKFDEIPGYSAIAHYNNNHFINVTGVVKDGDVITHVIVTNGYINGVEQTKTIKIDEFRENYEGKILSVEKSNYDKRLTDDQLKNIKGAGWLSKFWKKVKKIFKKIFRALKKILKYIIEPIKQFIK
ncbi:MAG: discoidin domain-containing protein, partial [Candidatus Aureabacteria bacterium]|nr:discoidin domain-containing protein [Candidatus Auribacterota bacterium]